MQAESLPILSNPEIMGGTPVFAGTRVPVQTFVEYIEAGDPLDEFLVDFPSVTREQPVVVLELAKELLLARAAAYTLQGCSRAPRDTEPCGYEHTA